jgi:hypothetical protein
MKSHRKAWIAALLAALMFTFAVGAASALRSLSISGSTTLTLNGRFSLISEATRVECNATITKTISRVIPKVDHILIGKITRVDVERTMPSPTCRSSSGTLSNIEIRGLEREEFGRILKGTILGTLPNITGVLLLVDRFQASFTDSTAGRCGYESPERGLPGLVEVEARGNLVRLRLEANRAVAIEGGIFCPRTGEFLGEMTPLQTTGIRLI